MKIKLTAGMMDGNNGVIPAGTVQETSDEEAQRLVELGVAEYTEDTVVADEDTATEKPEETQTPVDEGAGEEPSAPLESSPEPTPVEPDPELAKQIQEDLASEPDSTASSVASADK